MKNIIRTGFVKRRLARILKQDQDELTTMDKAIFYRDKAVLNWNKFKKTNDSKYSIIVRKAVKEMDNYLALKAYEEIVPRDSHESFPEGLMSARL